MKNSNRVTSLTSSLTPAQSWELGLSHAKKVSAGGQNSSSNLPGASLSPEELKKKIRLAMLRRLSQAIGEVRPFSFSDSDMDDAAWAVRNEVIEMLADMMLSAS